MLKSRRGTEKGTGLGLLISKEFIAKNQGRLQIESVPGKGSVFGFATPAMQPQKTPAHKTGAATE